MRVVLAVNELEAADRIAAGALNYGVTDRDEIAVITVKDSGGSLVWSLLPSPIAAEIDKEEDERFRMALREAGQFLRTELHSPHVTEYKLEGDLVDQLHKFLEQWHADLLIIGFTENMPWADHAAKIVRTAPCPVLVVGKHFHEQPPNEKKPATRKLWHEPSYTI